MTTLTIQTDLERKYWYVAIDGQEHRKFLAHNGSDNSGQLQAQRKLAQLIEEHMSKFPESAHRIAYLATELVQETGLSCSVSLPRPQDPGFVSAT